MKNNPAPRFLIWHVPHDGKEFPDELLSSVCIPREEFLKYHEKMRDAEVGSLIPEGYPFPSAAIHFKTSRLLCDPERFIGPEEIMERYGMGCCYEKVYDGTVIKKISEQLKKKTLRYYTEHHKRIDELCRRYPRTLLFDMHSYSDDIVPEDFLQPGRETPDVCIGTDSHFTPPELAALIRSRFEEAGLSTTENYPYSGCYVPNSAMAGKCDCVSVMLEFNKRTYLDGDSRTDEGKAAVIRGVMEKIVRSCKEF